jgi:hypothetical protein
MRSGRAIEVLLEKREQCQEYRLDPLQYTFFKRLF